MAKPLKGTIVAYAITDGVGRIRLDDGEELRFRVRELQNVVPAIGVQVEVGDTEPYPLGGRRALAITLADDRASYEKRRKEFEKAQGAAMRGDLGRRTEELDLPADVLAAALERGLKGSGLPGVPATIKPPRATPARPAPRRAPTPRPVASERAATTRPTGRATTARPTGRATTARPTVKTVARGKGKSSRGDRSR